jgi:hypothetical protein
VSHKAAPLSPCWKLGEAVRCRPRLSGPPGAVSHPWTRSGACFACAGPSRGIAWAEPYVGTNALGAATPKLWIELSFARITLLSSSRRVAGMHSSTLRRTSKLFVRSWVGSDARRTEYLLKRGIKVQGPRCEMDHDHSMRTVSGSVRVGESEMQDWMLLSRQGLT